MQSDGSKANAGIRFANDLKRIREARGHSIEDIHAETKAPLDLIGQFERSALLDHPMYNHVYLRSFVRSYAEVLGISVTEVMKALDMVVEGQYEDQLASRYLGEKKPPQKRTPAKTAEQKEPKPPEEPAQPPPKAPLTAPVKPTKAAPQGRQESSPSKPQGSSETKPQGLSGTKPQEVSSTKPQRPSETSPSGASAPTAGHREPASSIRQRHAAKGTGGRTSWPSPSGGLPLSMLVIAGTSLILVVVLAFYWFFFREVQPDHPVAPVVAADSVAAPAPPAAPTRIVLSDTMAVYVVAATAKVEGLRVTVDEGVRAPYWIEPGDSLLFRVRESIVLSNMLLRIRISVDGYRYPHNPPDAAGPVVISREAVEAYLNRGR